jgi:hypothetical protein
MPGPAKETMQMIRTSTVLVCMIAALLLAVGGVALASPNNVPDAGTVQTDGQVSAIVVSGNKIYLGGYFTHVDGVQRNRLAAIDATTGQLTGWNPNANDNVRSLALLSSPIDAAYLVPGRIATKRN